MQSTADHRGGREIILRRVEIVLYPGARIAAKGAYFPIRLHVPEPEISAPLVHAQKTPPRPQTPSDHAPRSSDLPVCHRPQEAPVLHAPNLDGLSEAVGGVGLAVDAEGDEFFAGEGGLLSAREVVR